jgi:hypothetical protein
MAAILPTPSTLRSWEEAFDHPLPVVRKLETQLRTQITENQNKLRSLVGTSYRDLLGTAERIIEMDGQMQLVEENLAGIGRRCDYRVVERSRNNLGRLGKSGGQEEEKRLEIMARVKVLKSALEAVIKIVRKGGNALGAAKVLVLARLLHKSISDSDNVPPVLAELKKKLAGARRRLLAYIERSLAKTTGDRTVLSNTMCAYAMITSSAPKEILRHFLQVRYEQLESLAETPNEDNSLAMLDLYGKTLVDTRDLFPRRLADALGQLSKVPLLQDDQLTSIQELNLDIYRRWIPEDIRTFTPWVRNDQLTASETSEGLMAWAKQAQAGFVQALEESLRPQRDAQVVLSTRRKVLSRFLSVSSKLRNDNFTQSIKDMQGVFMKHLEELAAHSADLQNFALKSLDNSDQLQATTAQTSPWALAAQSLDLSSGALSFRAAILDRRHGRSEPVKLEHDALDRWTAQLNSHWDFVTSMRAAKWDDDLDFDLDDLDYEGDESIQDALSRNDAAKFERKLRESTTEAFKKAYNKIDQASATRKDQAALFIRLLRELDLRRRALSDRLDVSTDKNSFDHTAIISNLHTTLAEQASQQPLEAFKKTLSRKQSTVPAISLWEGSPALPTQLSPAAFRFLTALQTRMAELGDDVWSPRAVHVLQSQVCRVLAGATSSLPDPTAPATESDTKKADADADTKSQGDDAVTKTEASVSTTDETDRHRNVCLQRLFDAMYFSSAFCPTTATATTTKQANPSLQDHILKLREAASVDSKAEQRMAKSASEAWKRTGLLFGLLLLPTAS